MFRRSGRLFVALLTVSLLAAACGSDGDDATTADSSAAATTAAPATTAAVTIPEHTVAPEEEEAPAEEAPAEEEAPATTTTEAVPPPEGTLRYVEFSAVTTFNPAGAQAAQSVYVYPVYDTLTRQRADLTLAPSLATSWSQPEPAIWEFTVRDDVVFHDGAAFNAQVAVDNLLYHKNFEGNPNKGTWAAITDVTLVDDITFQVHFEVPAPQFPLEMSMVMGMMISPNALDGTDISRDPQGSGPWIWSAEDSQAGVTEVFNLNPNYWNPADQGVETVTVTAAKDNVARLNAFLTGEADIMSTVRDAQLDGAMEPGNVHLGVPNYFPYLLITGRDGAIDAPLADIRVRQAILYSIDREAYNAAIHAGKGDSFGGIYPRAFSQFHVPALDDAYPYDPDKARELLAEAGYPDGITIQAPIMPVINPHVEMFSQMLAASGITVDQIQINNGELGPRTRKGEWGITWFRDLLVHPARDFGKFISTTGAFNPFGLDDLADLEVMMTEAANETDAVKSSAIYAEVATQLVERGVIIPLAHGQQNNVHTPNLTGVVLGLNMQAAMPYGVRLG